MVLRAALSVGIDVDHDPAELGKVVEQLVPNFARDIMALRYRQAGRHGHTRIGVEPVSDPSRLDVGDVLDAGDVPGGVSDLVYGVRLHTVEHPQQDGASRLPDDDHARR